MTASVKYLMMTLSRTELADKIRVNAVSMTRALGLRLRITFIGVPLPAPTMLFITTLP